MSFKQEVFYLNKERNRKKEKEREISFTLINESEMRYDVNIAFSECVPRKSE